MRKEMADCRGARETLVAQMQHQEQSKQQQQRRGYSSSNVRRDQDEDLTLFQDMRNLDSTQILHLEPEDATNLGALSDPIAEAFMQRKGVGSADLLNTDADKNDYDWLLTPPGTPLFPSIDLDSPAAAYSSSLQQRHLLRNNGLAGIKTCQMASNSHVADAPAAALKSVRSNPSPTRRSSTPLSGHSNSAQQGGTPTSLRSNSVRPSTPTRSSTSASKLTQQPSTPTRQSSITSTGRPSTTSQLNQPSTPTNQPSTSTRQSSITTTGRHPTAANSNWPSTPTSRPSTPTRQSSMTSTGRSFPANSNWPSSPANQPSTPAASRPSTSTLRRSSSTSTQPFSTATCKNPSPTRSTARSGVARGISPARSQYQGSSPARGRSSPVSSMIWASSPRAHPVIVPGRLPSDIPSNLRTRSEHPSPAHHRQTVYSAGTDQMPDGLHHPSHRPSSPNLIRSGSSTSHRKDHVSAHTGQVPLDDDSSYELSSKSAVSKGLTLERGVRYGRQQSSVGNEDWQSPSHRNYSQIVSLPSRKTPDSASRSSEIQRCSSSRGFQPVPTKNSISTYDRTQAATALLCRPVTPRSTASSEQGASVALDSSEGDEDWLNGWRQLELSLGGHADIFVLNKQVEKSTSWDGSQHEQNLKLLESTIHSEKGTRASSVLKGEPCGEKTDIGLGEERESPSLEKDVGTLKLVREKLMLLSSPDLEQHKKPQKSHSGNSVEQSSPSCAMLSVHELCAFSQVRSNDNLVTFKEVETGSNVEAARKICVCNNSGHPEKCSENSGCECSTGHAGTAAKVEVEIFTHNEAAGSEAVKTVLEDVFKRDDGDSSTSLEELEHGSDPGEALLWPFIANTSEELGEFSKSRVMQETGESKVQAVLHSRWDRIEMAGCCQDLKKTGPDPRAASTPQIVHADQVSAEIRSQEDAEHEVQNTEHETIANFADILEDGGHTCLSHPRSSESSGSFQASSLDVSWSISTISSCPSNSSCEDPQYCLNSGVIWDPKPSPTNAHVSDVSDLASLPMGLHKQGADVINSSPGFDQHAFVKRGNVKAGQPEGHRVIRQNYSDKSCLDYFVDALEPKMSSGLQMAKKLKVLKDPETKKAEIMTMNNLKTNTPRKSSKTLTSREAMVESAKLGPQTAKTLNLEDSVQLPNVKVSVLPNVVLSPVTEEIIENSEFLGPNAKKHLSSFKFESRKASTLEAERKDIINRDSEILLNGHSKQAPPLLRKTIGKSQTPRAKAVGAPTGPCVSKVNSVRAGSPMRTVHPGGDSRPTQLTQWNTIGRMTEEPNGHSRFSNITRRLAAAAAAARAQTQRRWFPGT